MDRNLLVTSLKRELDHSVILSDNFKELFEVFINTLRRSYQDVFGSKLFKLSLRGAIFDTCFPFLQWARDETIINHMGRMHAVFIHSTQCVSLSNKSSRALFVDEYDVVGSGLLRLSDSGASSCDKETLSPHCLSRVLFPYLSSFKMDCPSSCKCYHDDLQTLALPVSIAFSCIDYSGSHWLSRKREWPSTAVANLTASSPVYIIPACEGAPHWQSKLTNEKPTEKVPWRYDFSDWESVLMNEWSCEVKFAYHLLLRIIPTACEIQSCILPFDILVRHAIFWAMERSLICKSVSTENIVAWCLTVCDTINSFVVDEYFPHYFISDVNILCRFNSGLRKVDICKHSMICDASFDKPQLVSASRPGHFNLQSAEEFIIRQLESAYRYSVDLLGLQLYQRLHWSTSVTCRIELHKEIIQYLETNSTSMSDGFTSAILSWVVSSLGVEYYLKACTSKSPSEKQSSLREAELNLSKSLNSFTSLACMGQFLIQTGKPAQALNLLEEALRDSKFDESEKAFQYSDNEETKTLNKQNFTDRLNSLWVYQNVSLDSMFYNFQEPVLPKDLVRSLSFLECQILGTSEFPVFKLRSKFMVLYLMATCLKALDKRKEMLELLHKIESSTENSWVYDPTEDRNQVAYLNLLAGLHAEVNNMNDVTRLYRKSSSVMKNPRNKATLSLFAIGARRWFRSVVKWIILVFSGAAVVLFAHLCSVTHQS